MNEFKEFTKLSNEYIGLYEGGTIVSITFTMIFVNDDDNLYILTQTLCEPLWLVIMFNCYCASVQEHQDDNLDHQIIMMLMMV